MGGNGLIDTSGSTPSLKIGALVTTFLSTLVYGWYVGLIQFIDAVGDGLNSAADDVEVWLVDMIGLQFSIPAGFLDGAARAHGEWLAGLGLAGQFVAFAEGVFVFVLILYTLSTGFSWAWGAI